MNIPEIEKNILEFWKKNKIFEKSLEKKSAKGNFVFYDGPPFATGTPHYGHIVASLIKDMVPRYRTMQGYYVQRKWGWDCHGLPIENIVEQELKFKSKKDIEEFGIDKFNKSCESKVMLYAEEWKKVIERLGRWVDMENDYKTMDLDYMESVWWVFKQLWDKKLIYKGHKSMHICPRCETTLSQSEIAEGYKDVEDISGTFKFELIDEPKTYILAWTTTPWTLPGNVALAFGKEIDYIKFSAKGTPKKINENYIVSKRAFNDYREEIKKNGAQVKILQKLKGKDLEGKKYKPLFNYFLNKDLKNKKNLYTIQLADFVTVEDGTGVVHIAPAFGEDDMNLGKEKDLPFIQHVSMDGRFTKDMKDFAGLEVKPKNNPMSTDEKIIDYLEKKNLVFKTEKFTHSYPYCWRCESPLLNYATDSWFVKVSKIKDKMLENAKNINWIPNHIKKGRFGMWLQGAKDWSISRQRFWGSVMPVWVCESCGEKKVFGSIKELEKVSGKKIKDLHKQFIDKIEFDCKCGKKMKRIPDVLDCWFESGSMPYSQMHYPFENKKKFEKNFPAEFIAEGVDQTRAWFYYLHVLSTAIKEKESFQNVIVNGTVLAQNGKKMSKRLNNYPDPMYMFDKYGADAVRYYLASSQVVKAEDLNFSEKGVDEIVKKVLLTLLNVFSFYKMFEIDIKKSFNSDNLLDKWIISRLESLKEKITHAYNKYDLNKATRPIGDFINELSTWYLRRSRQRIKDKDKKAIQTLKYVLIELCKLMAPVIPFLSDYIYFDINKKSVHLEDWPKKENLVNKDLEEKMEKVRDICSLALQKRTEAGIKVRQPLLTLKIPKYKLEEGLLELIKDEVNVKNVVLELKQGVELDLKLTKELKDEGMVREFIRSVQVERKKQGLTPKDRINLYYNDEIIEKNKEQVLKAVIADKLIKGDFKIEKI